MTNVEIGDLTAALEQIRQAKYPDIPAELIASLVQAQAENQDNVANRRSRTVAIIQDYLKTLTVDTTEGEG